MTSSPQQRPHQDFDAIVIGSGFGGTMAAYELVRAGMRVLMIERGGWVERGPHNWESDGAFIHTPHYAADSAFRIIPATRTSTQRLCTCVGGPSVFFGGAAFRFRERDFESNPEIVADSGADWPIDYAALEPFYTDAERLLRVSGDSGQDPTEPPRSARYATPARPLTAPAHRIAEAARSLGLRPFRIPLAINHEAEHGGTCVGCATCDAYACAVSAKGDLATRVIPALLADGMTLLCDTVVRRLLHDRGRVHTVECVDKRSGEILRFRGAAVVLAAGALATPHLLLASGLDRLSQSPQAVGRYLMRHCNAMVYGIFARRPNAEGVHHKQIAIHDFYFGADAESGVGSVSAGAGSAPPGKLGNLQQIMAPAPGLLQHVLPRSVARLVAPAAQLLTGMLCLAEDQPRIENGVRIDRQALDEFELPRLIVEHSYSDRDQQARRFLVRQARRLLRRAGALVTITWPVSTFSHAMGTVRMGEDAGAAPLDAQCRYRGVENLWVTDGSAFPTSAGVNPSLTIAANAMRAGRAIAEGAERSTAGLGASASA
ncbi:MAG TPA: GMC family oxidoreductase [Gemmatimonadaceae bacterium]|nr:GMC family oxidoreductase [Gemmatimonadaceae bacterium]